MNEDPTRRRILAAAGDIGGQSLARILRSGHRLGTSTLPCRGRPLHGLCEAKVYEAVNIGRAGIVEREIACGDDHRRRGHSRGADVMASDPAEGVLAIIFLIAVASAAAD